MNRSLSQNDLQIVTTNYDDSFAEIARQDTEVHRLAVGAGITFKSYAGSVPTGTSRTEIPIVYIHGRIPRQGKITSPVFSETDYVDWMHRGVFRDYVARRFDQGTTLMLGASLRDYNIVSYIKRTQYDDDEVARIAVLPMQDDPAFEEAELGNYPAIDRLRALRGEALGISMLSPDYYGQVYQLIYEMRYAVGRLRPAAPRTKNDRYRPYMRRLEDWWAQFQKLNYTSNSVKMTTLSLKERAADLHATTLHDADHLKLELWIRPNVTAGNDPRVLELWCNSQSMNLPNTIRWEHHVSLADRHASPAVAAFALRNAFYSEDKSRTDRRWTHVVAAPIVLEDSPYDGVPVGVVVLRLNAPKFAGQKATPKYLENEGYVSEFLIDLGVEALSPKKSPASRKVVRGA